MNRCRLQCQDTKEYAKMLKIMLKFEEGRVPDRNPKGWRLKGEEECMSPREEFEVGGFMAQEALWKTITAILPGSKLSCLLFDNRVARRVKRSDEGVSDPQAEGFVDDIRAFVERRNKELAVIAEKVLNSIKKTGRREELEVVDHRRPLSTGTPCHSKISKEASQPAQLKGLAAYAPSPSYLSPNSFSCCHCPSTQGREKDASEGSQDGLVEGIGQPTTSVRS